MKRGIIFSILIVFAIFVIHLNQIESKETFQTIPDEAIRLRILANSDSEYDQKLKHHVRDEVNAYITELVQHIDNIEEGRRTIAASVPEIKKIVEQTLSEEESTYSYTVEYRSDVTFPTKVYDNFVYPAGEYEAVLITIGEGKGANWWCVLFPPLCFLDFSNGTTVESSNTDDEEIVESEVEELDEEEEHEEELDEEIVMEEDEEDVKIKFFLFEWLGLT